MTPKQQNTRSLLQCFSYLQNKAPTWNVDYSRLPGRRRQGFATHAPSRLKTALFFPGQGVQKVGMATPWLEAFPSTAKPFLEEMDHLVGCSLSKIIEEGPSRTLTTTENSQPAIMATSILILRVLEEEFGFKTSERVDFTLGHSLGEFAALVAGGYMDYPTSLKLVRRRGEVMARCSRRASEESGDSHGMVALLCEPGRLTSLISTINEFLHHDKADASEDPAISQVQIANINSKTQIVLSGNLSKIRTLLVQLRQFSGHDPRAVMLKSDSPFHHSEFMAPAAEFMKKLLKQTEVKFPTGMPCISNVTALPFTSADNLKNLLARQCIETVRWWDSIKYLDQEEKVRRWVGIGPGKVGRNLVGKEVGMRGRDLVKGGGVWAICDPRDIEDVLRGLEQTEAAQEED
ncbi:MAG: hypothetical protein M1834_001894 [Cirrosporium novae-zelandiae]|nr:MAG: hypothetical protein M1834_001894 [Cirrosporium novae-zelandiae]